MASRVNGCVVCVSMHAGRVIGATGRGSDVDKLLAEGAAADLGDGRWNAVAAAAAALTRSPMEFSEAHLDALDEAGLDLIEILDVINCAAYFNWSNRLMLSLGQAQGPKPVG